MSDPSSSLTPAQLADFNRDGYLIIPDALPPHLVSSLMEETAHLLNILPLETHPMTRFSTSDDNHVGVSAHSETGHLPALLPPTLEKQSNIN